MLTIDLGRPWRRRQEYRQAAARRAEEARRKEERRLRVKRPAIVSAAVRGRGRPPKALGRRYTGCEWDDVAFKPTVKEPKFCSKRCREAWETAGRTHYVTSMAAEPQRAAHEDLVEHAVLLDRRRSGQITLSRIEESRARPVGLEALSAYILELESRTSDELEYRPPRRIRWIDTNLAVSEMY